MNPFPVQPPATVPSSSTVPPFRVVYLSNVMPALGGGGAIVVQRHLEHLVRRGWNVTAIESRAAADAAPPWHSVSLPVRRWWQPPLRPRVPGLAALGSLVWRRRLHQSGVTGADVVVTVCWGPLSWLAAECARAWRRPLVAIVHDHWTERRENPDAGYAFRRACRQAVRILAVSFEMQARLSEEFGPKVDLLYPVPAWGQRSFATWRTAFADRPRVAHAGTLHPFHAVYLERVATELAALHGELLVLCPAQNETLAHLRKRCPNVVHHDYFPDNDAALRWLAEQASALTVMHTRGLDETGRPPTGFPSRLVELVQLGLPIVIAAPEINPLARWARQHSWIAFTAPDDSRSIGRVLARLTRVEIWSAAAAQTCAAAQSDLNPERIHAQFEGALMNVIATAPRPRR